MDYPTIAELVYDAYRRLWAVVSDPWVYGPLAALETISLYLLVVRLNERSKGDTSHDHVTRRL